MTVLVDVREINYVTTPSAALVIKHVDQSTFQVVEDTFGTNVGRKFQATRKNGVWEMEIDSGEVSSGDFTEIQTPITGSDLDFKDFNSNDSPVMAFIGIIDIRDGTITPTMNLLFEASHVSVKTDATAGKLIVKKEHIS